MAGMTADDYLTQLRQLLPPGPAWDRDHFGADLDKVLEGLSKELARIDERGDVLLSESFPPSVRELLPDWERVMGLPDPCLDGLGTFEQRRASVLRRHLGQGGQSLPYFVDIAKSMGYPEASAVEWRAPRFGRARFGRARFGTWGAQFVWVLKLGARRPGGRRFGVTVWGERFGANPNEAIECVIKRWAPAHTTVFFEYD